MKANDRAILIGLALVGLAAAFYFLILAPKRDEASELEAQQLALQAEVAQAEQEAADGQMAKKDFATNYRELITLGKAVPVDADTPSLLTQLETLSVRAGIDFRSIALSSGSGATAAPPTDPAAATEASAATLPIGATVGPAGLPVMPYELQFEGGFFEIADFFGRVDDMVTADGEATNVNGRLLTIDGFTFSPGPTGLPHLTATVSATSYLAPADEGITAGATPTGPAVPSADDPTQTTTPPEDPAASPVSSAAVAN